MGIPFLHASNRVTPKDIDASGSSRIVLSEYKSFEHSLQSDVLSLKYVLEGVEEYTVNGKSHLVQAGQFLLVQPGDQVSVGWSSPEAVRGVCFYFDDVFTSEYLQSGHSTMIPSRVFVADKRIHDWYADYIKGKTSAEESWWIGAGMTNDVLRQYHSRAQKLNTRRPTTKNAILQTIYDSILYLENHALDKFDLEALAFNACMSKYHFLRMFKQVTGFTPQNYHQQIRYKRACELLVDEGTQIQEVAWELGFHELAAFSKFFKKHSGETPSAWRKNPNQLKIA
ncbi:MAG: helix-turn-helix transcriptional regulator [Flavobacteriia bacterium]|nr:helix-turn-helix transcriptional regulator [Flavobacteriia bacterium]